MRTMSRPTRNGNPAAVAVASVPTKQKATAHVGSLLRLFAPMPVDTQSSLRSLTPTLNPELKKNSSHYTGLLGPTPPPLGLLHRSPLQFLFPETQLSDWGRYLGASIGGSDALTDDFINKRLSSALALLPILPHLTGRTK